MRSRWMRSDAGDYERDHERVRHYLTWIISAYLSLQTPSNRFLTIRLYNRELHRS